MPGGKPTVTPTPLDLSSFLQRKRRPLNQWLESNSITSEKALEGLLADPTWSVSHELAATIRAALIKPIEPPAAIVAPVVDVAPVAVEKPQVDDVILPETAIVVVEEEPLKQVVVEEEEPLPVVAVEGSEGNVSLQFSAKERKRNR